MATVVTAAGAGVVHSVASKLPFTWDLKATVAAAAATQALTNHLMFESAFRRSFFFLGGGEGRKKSKIDLFMRKLEREDRDREM